MNLIISTDTPFGDENVLQDFLFENSMNHHQIASALFTQGKPIDVLPIAEMGNVNDWLLVHEQRHQQELAYLGINEPINLANVDFNDQFQFYDWMQHHAELHVLVNNSLGLK